MPKHSRYCENNKVSETIKFTAHARDRMMSRSIPEGIVGIILEYGEPACTIDGAERLALTKRGLKEYRKRYGVALAKALEPFRRAYVVVDGSAVITAAFSKSPMHG